MNLRGKNVSGGGMWSVLRCGTLYSRLRLFQGVVAFVCAWAVAGWSPATAQVRPPNPGDAFEVQTRGPIHEAFAETVVNNPAPGLTVPEACRRWP